MTKTNNGRRKYREKISKENKTITQCPYQFEKLRDALNMDQKVQLRKHVPVAPMDE